MFGTDENNKKPSRSCQDIRNKLHFSTKFGNPFIVVKQGNNLWLWRANFPSLLFKQGIQNFVRDIRTPKKFECPDEIEGSCCRRLILALTKMEQRAFPWLSEGTRGHFVTCSVYKRAGRVRLTEGTTAILDGETLV